MSARDDLVADREATLRRLSALEREFRGVVESAAQAGTDDEHDPEGATLAYERQHVAALMEQARDHLSQVDAALGRLAGGTYGVCETCGQPISVERLMARPVASTCLPCASRR